MINNNYTKIVNENYSSHKDLPAIIILLKNAGASQLETLMAIRQCVSIKIPEIDILILNSPVWKSAKDVNLRLRDNFLDEETSGIDS